MTMNTSDTIELHVFEATIGKALLHKNCGGIIQGEEGEEGYCRSCESKGEIKKVERDE